MCRFVYMEVGGERLLSRHEGEGPMSKIRGAVIAALLVAATCHFAHAGGPVIGGFDFDRGGEESLIPSENATLSAEISSAFPGATFQFTSELTPQFFSGVQVAIFGVATAPRSSVDPLTTSEQSALLNFVLGGGTALIFADNTGYSAESPTTNASFLSPFGVTMTGNLGGVLTAPLVNPTGPLTGPYPASAVLWKLPRVFQRYRTGDGAGQFRRGRAGRRLFCAGCSRSAQWHTRAFR